MDITMELGAGEYLLVCFIAGPDGVPHMVKGMRRWFTVTAPGGDPPPLPVADARVEMVDFAYTSFPETVERGPLVLEVTNAGEEIHEMVVMRLEDATLDEVLSMVTSPPPADAQPRPELPVQSIGGVQALPTGGRAWVTLDLSPGEYAVLCFISSPANENRMHAALGMAKAFTVGE